MKRILIFIALLFCAGCAGPGLEPQSRSGDPLGWPGQVFTTVGRAGEESGIPLVRETGRLSYGLGDILDSPALFAEGIVELDPSRSASAFTKLTIGAGGTVTAATEIPFFFVSPKNVDLAPYAPLVNDALAYLDRATPAPGEDRVFPLGTRVRASGKNLIWIIPGEGEFPQVAEESVIFRAACWAVDGDYSAQERGFGFVVPDAAPWSDVNTFQVGTIMHEFYHQYREIHHWFLAWEPVYFIAYFGAYPFQGYDDHWAESAAKGGAYRVQEALQKWSPPPGNLIQDEKTTP
jgi:hypothetical protein